MSEAFSQKYALVAKTTAGGRVISGPKIPGCLVRIELGVLTVSHGPQVVTQAAVQGLEIVTPPMYRKIGTGVVVRIDGQLWSIEFDTVYQAEKLAATKPGVGRFLKAAFAAENIAAVPKGMHLGKEITKTFLAALLAEGAVDKTGAASLRAVPDSPVAPGTGHAPVPGERLRCHHRGRVSG
ncbi:MAG TPA: hypothetical protein VG142_16420 [Trebonia sp.]|nr:hypothetical protein [Trebonia sp.]